MFHRTIAVVLVVMSNAVVSAQVDLEGRGLEALRRNNCAACHSVLGAGGGSAPDLALRRPGNFSPEGFASLLWNHGPRMWTMAKQRDVTLAPLSVEDATYLYGYLFSRRYYDPAGVASYGQQVWKDNNCYRCHGLVGENSLGPPVSTWNDLDSPIDWARSMWNHAGPMAEQIDIENGVWPVLELQEFMDLIAFVRGETMPTLAQPSFSIEQVSKGEQIFNDGVCSSCHRVGRLGAGDIDLTPAARRKTLTGLALEMWNHGPVMSTSPIAQEVELEPFEKGEMAAVLSYITLIAQVELGGNSDQGRVLVENSGCLSCHGPAGEVRGLDSVDARFSAMDFAAAVWSHGPAMSDEMTNQALNWPQFTPSQIVDIIAYLQ